MSHRELVVLGTASQAPTRRRNHNGYYLRWDEAGLLFDPGEGTQRQMLFAGVTTSQVTSICITHFHGDHCLGLPGVLQRMSLDQVPHAVEIFSQRYESGDDQQLADEAASAFGGEVVLARDLDRIPVPARHPAAAALAENGR